jgi:hypothetical protein
LVRGQTEVAHQCHAPRMEILASSRDSVDVRLDHDEANGLYNLLVEAESWPNQAVGARPFIRQIREALHAALVRPQTDEQP